MIVTAITLIAHTYLVIFPNGGFAPNGGSKILTNILALKGNKFFGTLLWTILAYVLTTAFYKIRALGAKRFFSGLVKGPFRAIKSLNKKYLPFFAGLTGIILLANYFLIKNNMLAITLAIGAFFSIIAYKYSLGYLVLALGHSDINRIRKKEASPFDERVYDILHLSMISGMLLYVLLPKQPISIYITIALLLVVVFFEQILKLRKNKVATFLFFLSINILCITALKVFADDGGVAEAGGILMWFGSTGSGIAVLIGLPPAIGSALGVILGIVTNSGDFIQIFEGTAEEALEFLANLDEANASGRDCRIPRYTK